MRLHPLRQAGQPGRRPAARTRGAQRSVAVSRRWPAACASARNLGNAARAQAELTGQRRPAPAGRQPARPGAGPAACCPAGGARVLRAGSRRRRWQGNRSPARCAPLSSTRPGRRSARRRAAAGCSAPARPRTGSAVRRRAAPRRALQRAANVGPVRRQAWADRSLDRQYSRASSSAARAAARSRWPPASSPSSRMNRGRSRHRASRRASPACWAAARGGASSDTGRNRLCSR